MEDKKILCHFLIQLEVEQHHTCPTSSYFPSLEENCQRLHINFLEFWLVGCVVFVFLIGHEISLWSWFRDNWIQRKLLYTITSEQTKIISIRINLIKN